MSFASWLSGSERGAASDQFIRSDRALASGASVLPIRQCGGERLGVCFGALGGLDDAGQSSGVGAMLDLLSVPVRPPQVDGEPNHTQERHDERSHDDEDRSPLIADNCARAQTPMASAVRIRRAARMPAAGGCAPVRRIDRHRTIPCVEWSDGLLIVDRKLHRVEHHYSM